MYSLFFEVFFLIFLRFCRRCVSCLLSCLAFWVGVLSGIIVNIFSVEIVSFINSTQDWLNVLHKQPVLSDISFKWYYVV